MSKLFKNRRRKPGNFFFIYLFVFNLFTLFPADIYATETNQACNITGYAQFQDRGWKLPGIWTADLSDNYIKINWWRRECNDCEHTSRKKEILLSIQDRKWLCDSFLSLGFLVLPSEIDPHVGFHGPMFTMNFKINGFIRYVMLSDPSSLEPREYAALFNELWNRFLSLIPADIRAPTLKDVARRYNKKCEVSLRRKKTKTWCQ